MGGFPGRSLPERGKDAPTRPGKRIPAPRRADAPFPSPLPRRPRGERAALFERKGIPRRGGHRLRPETVREGGRTEPRARRGPLPPGPPLLREHQHVRQGRAGVLRPRGDRDALGREFPRRPFLPDRPGARQPLPEKREDREGRAAPPERDRLRTARRAPGQGLQRPRARKLLRPPLRRRHLRTPPRDQDQPEQRRRPVQPEDDPRPARAFPGGEDLLPDGGKKGGDRRISKGDRDRPPLHRSAASPRGRAVPGRAAGRGAEGASPGGLDLRDLPEGLRDLVRRGADPAGHGEDGRGAQAVQPRHRFPA